MWVSLVLLQCSCYLDVNLIPSLASFTSYAILTKTHIIEAYVSYHLWPGSLVVIKPAPTWLPWLDMHLRFIPLFFWTICSSGNDSSNACISKDSALLSIHLEHITCTSNHPSLWDINPVFQWCIHLCTRSFCYTSAQSIPENDLIIQVRCLPLLFSCFIFWSC